jgi:hypothetical protein
VYKIEKAKYGVKLTFHGFIKMDEMEQWTAESKKILDTMSSGFNALVDMRGLNPLPRDAEAEMKKGQRVYKEKGLERSVVILSNSITTMQFKRIAKESGIDKWERYIDASTVKDWEQVGINWLLNGIDPDGK